MNQSDEEKFKSCVYYSNWSIYQRKHFPYQIPAPYCTHIFYAFIWIDTKTGKLKFSDEWSDLQVSHKTLIPNQTAHGNLQQLYQMKKLNRHLKVIMSIGGWGTDSQFEAIVNDDTKLGNFIQSCVEFVDEYGFDGVDIDWEYPKDNHQGDKLVDILKLLRSNLKDEYILTIAAPGGDENIAHLPIKQMDRYLTFWNIMCYDFTGEGWSTRTGHQSNLFGFNGDNSLNASDVIDKYRSAGVNSKKLVLGMPLYGRIFHGTCKEQIGESFSKHKEPNAIEGDTIDYKDISAYFSTKFDARKVGALAFDPNTKQLITFDNQQSVKVKSSFIRSNKLGGGMFWDSAGDKEGSDSLIITFVDQLGGTDNLNKDVNNLNYNNSICLQNLQSVQS